jgi:CheY-like chemotaxis protein
VLVVDDEAGVREVTQAVLRKHNYEVLVASDGTEALAAFAQRPREVSVVLTDVVMPHIDGVALTRALRKLNPDVRVVAATGHAQNHRAAELRSLEVQGFIHKPFSAETLLQVVYSALHS